MPVWRRTQDEGSGSRWVWSCRQVPGGGVRGHQALWELVGVLYVFTGRLKDRVCGSSLNTVRFLTKPVYSSEK